MRRLIGIFLAGWIATAQAPVFRATTELVQVNVVALDKRGKPVADLGREEFQIFDNGAPQEIRVFTGQGEARAAAPLEVKALNTFTNVISTHAQGGHTILLIDNLHSGSDPTDEEGTAFARARALRMLRSIPEGERVAIYAPGIKFSVICEFTPDRDLLERQLRKWRPTPTTPVPQTRPILRPGAEPDPLAAIQARSAAEMQGVEESVRFAIGDSQFQALADHVAGIPGRKKLIWLANKFPIGGRALQSLNRAGISIYPVDLDGVCRPCPPRPKQVMDALAAITGGVAYYGRNDIETAMLEAIDDAHVSYMLGFYASSDGTASVHRLAISVSRPGVTLRYGNTYQPSPPPPATVSIADLVRAMNRPVDATAIPIQASFARARDRLSLDVKLNVESLELAPDQEGWSGKIEFVARFTTADAVIAGDAVGQTVTFHLSKEKYDAAVRDGVAYHNELRIPTKSAELKLLFANPASGKIGTLTVPIGSVK